MGNRMRTRLAGLIVQASLAAVAVAGHPNLLKDGDGEGKGPTNWTASQRVAIERTSEKQHGGTSAVKVTWRDVTSFAQWGRCGNLLNSSGAMLTESLKRDTRYRLSCWVLVDEFELTPEAKAWLGTFPKGMLDPPTVTIGCHGGAWNSGMPWAAYDVGRKGEWQELSCEFTTPYNTGGGFRMHLDVYPFQNAQMQSSGRLFLDDVVLEECVTRIGFTKAPQPIVIDGSMKGWWETNPVVITSDQLVAGAAAPNRSGSGIVYTMWDDRHLYLAAKIIDDDAPETDGIAVWLDGREHVVTRDATPDGWLASVQAVEELGSTTNMYRIVSQFGEEVRGRNGYIVEVAIPISVLHKPPAPGLEFDMAIEILDGPRRLRFPRSTASGDRAELARAVLANEKGELRGGEYPYYAVTDAGNPRGQPRPLAIKNVADRVVGHARLGYPRVPFRRGATDKLDAIISWTTTAPASGHVEFGRDREHGKRVVAAEGGGSETGIAMRALLGDLEPNRRYHYRVVATTDAGGPAVTTDWLVLDTARTPVPGIEKASIPLTVTEPEGVARKGWPVTSGVPFPEGQLRSSAHLRLLAPDGTPVPAQFLTLADWPDGSVRWALVDLQADVPAGGTVTYTLEYGNAVGPMAHPTSLEVREDDDRVEIDTGAVSFSVSKQDFRLFDDVRIADRVVAGPGGLRMVDADGRAFVSKKPDAVDVEEVGPLRACVRVAGRYVDDRGKPSFGYDVRIHAFAGKPFVRVVHNYTCRWKDEEGFELPERRNPQPVWIRTMSIDLALTGAGRTVRVGAGADAEVRPALTEDAPLEIRQVRQSEATVAGESHRRLPGWLAVDDTLVAVQHFWQLYPKAVRVHRRGNGCLVSIDVMPEIAASEYPSEPNTVEDWVWGYLRDGKYRLRQGEGRSHEFWLTFGASPSDARDLATAQLAHPLMARAAPEWYADTRAAGRFHPVDERFAPYDEAFAEGFARLLKRRESEPFFDGRYGTYGMRNFGDYFGSDGLNWDNLEYDLAHCFLVQFMRTGDLRLFGFAREIHLHNRDVDCVSIRDGLERLCHHTGDHSVVKAGLGHTWCEGAWEHYFLTGDRRSARKALGISNDVASRAAGLCRSGTPGAAGSRNYGWSVTGLMAAYRATADPLYLNAAREVEEVAVRTQHPFRGGWIKRFSTGHCFHAPAHSGRVYFMQDIVLNGQTLFHELTRDPDVEECIVRACRGTLDEVGEHQAQGLPGLGYTSCPFLLIPGPWYPGREKHGFGAHQRYMTMYYAGTLPGGTDLAPRLFESWGESGSLWSGSFSDQAKFFAQGTRWSPGTMSYIAALRDAFQRDREQQAPRP